MDAKQPTWVLCCPFVVLDLASGPPVKTSHYYFVDLLMKELKQLLSGPSLPAPPSPLTPYPYIIEITAPVPNPGGYPNPCLVPERWFIPCYEAEGRDRRNWVELKYKEVPSSYANAPRVLGSDLRYYCPVHKATEWSIRVLEKQEESEEETEEAKDENGEEDDNDELLIKPEEIMGGNSDDADWSPAYSNSSDDLTKTGRLTLRRDMVACKDINKMKW